MSISNYNNQYTGFQYIIQYALNTDKQNIFKLPNIHDFSEYLTFSSLINNSIYRNVFCVHQKNAMQDIYFLINDPNLCYKMKLNHFYNTIYNNDFKQMQYKTYYIHYFSHCQKIYFNLIKFIHICKIKLSKPRNTYDLNENIINYNNSLPIIHNKQLYLFSKNDIIKLFYNSLINSNYEFYNDPLRIKNPYTNIPFSITHLYNMFLYVKYNSHNINSIIQSFYNCNLNLNTFILKHDPDISILNITRFVNNGCEHSIYKFIKIIILYYNANTCIPYKSPPLSLYTNFPRKAYITVYKDYLKLYLCSKYISDKTRSSRYLILFNQKMSRFANNTPSFGRIFKCITKPSFTEYTSHNDHRYMINNNKKYKIKFILKYIDFFNNNINELNINDYLKKDFILNINDINQLDDECLFNTTDSESDTETDTDNDNDDFYFASNPYSNMTHDIHNHRQISGIIMQPINSNDIIDQTDDDLTNIDQLC